MSLVDFEGRGKAYKWFRIQGLDGIFWDRKSVRCKGRIDTNQNPCNSKPSSCSSRDDLALCWSRPEQERERRFRV